MNRSGMVIFTLCTCFFLIALKSHTFPNAHSPRPSSSQGGLPELSNNEFFLGGHLLFQGLPPDKQAIHQHILNESDVVSLLDRLVNRKRAAKSHQLYWQPNTFEFNAFGKTKRVVPKKTWHISFMGDSRVRQLFAAFCQAMPDYDVSIFPENEANFSWNLFVPHHMIAYSELLNTIVSYYWFNLLVESEGRDVFKFLHSWLGYPFTNAGEYTPSPLPDVLVIGIGPHHMLKRHKDAHEDVYFAKLRELVPVLQNVSQYCKIIWLTMHPTLEIYGQRKSDNTDVHSLKIWHYNQVTYTVLKDSSIQVLSSGSPIVEEYVRSCSFNFRKDGLLRGFRSCLDYIHPVSLF